MKKVMLGLVMVMMLMSLVGCGETNSKNSDNYYVDSNTGNKVEVEVSTEKTYEFYVSVKDVKVYENGKVLYQLEYKIDDKVGYTVYETDEVKFEKGDVVKVTCGWNTTENKPSFQDIVSIEKVNE